MTVPSVLFIPDRYFDYRLWSDIPGRLEGRAQAIHFDQHDLPWMPGNGEFLEAARRLAPDGSFTIVAGLGQTARFAFALAEAGLAAGLVLFQPSLDSIPLPADVHVDLSSLGDLDHVLDPYLPIVSALDEPDAGRRRKILLNVVRTIAGQDLEPAGLELLLAMYSDHAEEIFADLRASAADGDQSQAGEQTDPDELQLPPWLESPWIDRLAELNLPVTTVVSARGRVIAEAIARRAKDAEIVVAGAGAGLEPAADRARAADAILRMLDRIG
jgi:hypothetical protein